jgi:hypothetical protein
MSAPESLTIEEEGLLEALDELPGRVLDLVRAGLPAAVTTPRTRHNIEALLDRIEADLRDREIDVVEAERFRSLVPVRRRRGMKEPQ